MPIAKTNKHSRKNTGRQLNPVTYLKPIGISKKALIQAAKNKQLLITSKSIILENPQIFRNSKLTRSFLSMILCKD